MQSRKRKPRHGSRPGKEDGVLIARRPDRTMCEETGLYEFGTQRDARMAASRGNRVRVFQCEEHPGHWHMTRERRGPHVE